MNDKTRVYEVAVDGATFRDPAVEAVIAPFLEAHGINSKLFMQGTPITVFRLPDGTFELETWTALPHHPFCDTCPPGCIRRERVVVPLAAPVPVVAGAQVYAVSDLELVEPSDPIAAAESAYRAALEEMARDASRANELVRQRRRVLQELTLQREQPAPVPAGPESSRE